MADTLESLELEVKHNSAGVDKDIDNITASLNRLQGIIVKAFPQVESLAKVLGTLGKVVEKSSASSAVSKVAVPLTRDTADAVRNANKLEVLLSKMADAQGKMESAINSGDQSKAYRARGEILSLDKQITREEEKMGSVPVALPGVFGKIQSACQRATSGLKNYAENLKKTQEESKKTESFTSKLIRSFKRIAFYRMIRSAISAVTSEIGTGLENVYYFSEMIGSSISQTMDRLTSMKMVMGNQLGAAFGELLTTIQPILEMIINLITRAADAVSQFFSVLGGRNTYHKAIDGTKKWAEQTQAGANAAKEWKNQLMSFDEINRLEAPSDGGAGAGSAANNIGSWELSPITMDFSWMDKIREFINGLDFGPLMESFNVLKEALSGLWETIKTGIEWIWQNILTPFITWIVEQFAPIAIETLASILNVVNAVLEVVGPVFASIWNTVLKPILSWVGTTVINTLKALNGFLQDLADLITGKITFTEFITGLSDSELAIGSVITALAAVFAGIVLFNTIVGIATTIVEIFSVVMAFFAANPAVLVALAIAAIIFVILECIRHWDEWKESIENWTESCSEYLGNGQLDWQDFGYVVGIVLENIMRAIENVIDFVMTLVGWIQTAVSWMQSLIDVANTNAYYNEQSGDLYATDPSMLSTNQSPIFPSGHFASGGYPDEGQLFVAREAGPEMVGTIGGRTAVATNADIVSAIEGGVFNAMSAALSTSGGSGSGTTILNINGREFMRAIWSDQQAVAREHGVALIAHGKG